MWQKQASIYPSIDYIKSKKCRVEIWFFPLVVDWMQADLNLQSILRKGRSLSGQNWRNLPYNTREKSAISLKDGVVQYVNSEIKTKFTNETHAYMNCSH